MKLVNLGCGDRWHKDWTNLDLHPTSEHVQAHDLYQSLPFADRSVDVIYASHVLEHLAHSYAPSFLVECHRVLANGGIIRVVVPDLEQICANYLAFLREARKGNVEAQEKYEWTLLELFDQMVRNYTGGAMREYWQRDPMPQEDFVVARTGPELKEVLKILRRPGHAGGPGGPRGNTPEDIGRFRISGEVHQWMYDSYSLADLLRKAGFSKAGKVAADESLVDGFAKYGLDLGPDGSVWKPDSLFMEAVK